MARGGRLSEKRLWRLVSMISNDKLVMPSVSKVGVSSKDTPQYKPSYELLPALVSSVSLFFSGIIMRRLLNTMASLSILGFRYRLNNLCLPSFEISPLCCSQVGGSRGQEIFDAESMPRTIEPAREPSDSIMQNAII